MHGVQHFLHRGSRSSTESDTKKRDSKGSRSSTESKTKKHKRDGDAKHQDEPESMQSRVNRLSMQFRFEQNRPIYAKEMANLMTGTKIFVDTILGELEKVEKKRLRCKALESSHGEYSDGINKLVQRVIAARERVEAKVFTDSFKDLPTVDRRSGMADDLGLLKFHDQVKDMVSKGDTHRLGHATGKLETAAAELKEVAELHDSNKTFKTTLSELQKRLLQLNGEIDELKGNDEHATRDVKRDVDQIESEFHDLMRTTYGDRWQPNEKMKKHKDAQWHDLQIRGGIL